MTEDRVTGCEAIGGCDWTGDVALAWVTRWDWYDDTSGRLQYLCPAHKAERDAAPDTPAEWRTPPFTVGGAVPA